MREKLGRYCGSSCSKMSTNIALLLFSTFVSVIHSTHNGSIRRRLLGQAIALWYSRTHSQQPTQNIQNENTRRAQTSDKANMVLIRSPYPESGSVSGLRTSDLADFENITGTSLFTGPIAFLVKFSWRSDQFFHRHEPNCGKIPYLAMLKNSSKNSWIRIRKRMTYTI